MAYFVLSLAEISGTLPGLPYRGQVDFLCSSRNAYGVRLSINRLKVGRFLPISTLELVEHAALGREQV